MSDKSWKVLENIPLYCKNIFVFQTIPIFLLYIYILSKSLNTTSYQSAKRQIFIKLRQIHI